MEFDGIQMKKTRKTYKFCQLLWVEVCRERAPHTDSIKPVARYHNAGWRFRNLEVLQYQNEGY